MNKDKESEPPRSSINNISPDRFTRKKKRENMTSSQAEDDDKSDSKTQKLGLPDVREAFSRPVPSSEDSIRFISTMDDVGFSWGTGEFREEEEEEDVDGILFGDFGNKEIEEQPEDMFDGLSRRRARKVIVENTRSPRMKTSSSSEEWRCHKCGVKFSDVRMLWMHIDVCDETQKPVAFGLPTVPTIGQFASGGFSEEVEDESPQIEIIRRRRRHREYQPRWIPGLGWEPCQEEAEETKEKEEHGSYVREYVPTGMSFEEQMEAALRASQGLDFDVDREDQFEEDTLRAIEMSVKETTPEAMKLVELHKEIDDMAIATAASLQSLSLKEFDCGWTKWESSFKTRHHPKFEVDAEPKHSMLWDVLRIMHMCGWLNTNCPKCYITRHGGSCIHFRPCDLKALFNMRRVCFSWMCIIDSWLAQFNIKKVVFSCTRCRVLGSKQKGTHLSQYYYTEKWEKTMIKLVNDYEMPNEEFECEFEGDH